MTSCEAERPVRSGVVVNDFSLSANGEFAALATRHGAVLLDLATLGTKHESKDFDWWNVAGPELASGAFRVAFSRLASGSGLAVASGRSVYLTDVAIGTGGRGHGGDGDAASGTTIGTVKWCVSQHLRPVNALDWSPHSPYELATCAEDCRFCIWDVREEKPVQSYLSPASWTAAVRWAPLNEYNLATGHEDAICIWDKRTDAQHMSVLASGQSRVLGVDWSLSERQKLLSVSVQQAQQPQGSIRIWDVTSPKKVHESISIDNGTPSSACFLPGSLVLAAVDSSIVLFALQNSKQKTAVVEVLEDGHDAPVSAVTFAHRGDGSVPSELRLASLSSADRCFRSWRYKLHEELRKQPETQQQQQRPRSEVSPQPRLRTETSITSPQSKPIASPDSPPLWLDEVRGSSTEDEAKFLGCLATQASLLRRLDCVADVASFRQALKNGGEEYQLSMEVTSANGIHLRITIGVDPKTPLVRKIFGLAGAAEMLIGQAVPPPLVIAGAGFAVLATSEQGAGHTWRVVLDWSGSYAGTVDGPLAPGVLKGHFEHLHLESLFEGSDELCRSVEAVSRMLLRRDGPAQLRELESDLAALQHPRTRRSKQSDELPFPRTCGMCWSPKGDLITFHSLQDINVPCTPRRWSFTDYRRILKIYREKNLRTVLEDKEDELTAAASRLRIDRTVDFYSSDVLNGLVEDHWWTATASRFQLEPTPPLGIHGLCLHNERASTDLGRLDLARVWSLLAVILDESLLTSPGGRSSQAKSFARRLVQQIINQLFDAQETLMLAMVGVALLYSAPIAKAPGIDAGRAKSAGSRKPRRRSSHSMSEALAPLMSVVPEPMRRKIAASHSWPSNPANMSELSSFTWSGPSCDVRDQRFMGSQRRTFDRSKQLGGLPWSADATVFSQSEFSPGAPATETSPTLTERQSCTLREPQVIHRQQDQDIVDIIPRDLPTLERLLHSAHAHCDLLHRLSAFCASRALARLLHHLQRYHELPLLETNPNGEIGLFGRVVANTKEEEDDDLYSIPMMPKSTSAPAAHFKGLSTVSSHSSMGGLRRTLSDHSDCGSTESKVVFCCVCQIRVRDTLYAPCCTCGHSYHVKCLRSWFRGGGQKCPVIGCTCHCLHQRPFTP